MYYTLSLPCVCEVSPIYTAWFYFPTQGKLLCGLCSPFHPQLPHNYPTLTHNYQRLSYHVVCLSIYLHSSTCMYLDVLRGFTQQGFIFHFRLSDFVDDVHSTSRTRYSSSHQRLLYHVATCLRASLNGIICSQSAGVAWDGGSRRWLTGGWFPEETAQTSHSLGELATCTVTTLIFIHACMLCVYALLIMSKPATMHRSYIVCLHSMQVAHIYLPIS